MDKRFPVAIFMVLVSMVICTVDKKPNILIFVVDDFGWGDFGANLKDDGEVSNTPYMDEFVKHGMRFTDFHAASSVCSPSRSALLTGRLGLRTGVNMIFGPYNVGGLPLTEHTLADFLKQADYKTFAIGKWHLGHHRLYHPIERGFDHYLGVPYSLDEGCLDNPGYILPPRPTCAIEQSLGLGLPLYKNKEIIQQPLNLKTLTNIYIEEFKERLNEHAIDSKNSSFFGYIPFSHLHVPLGFADNFLNSSTTIFGDTVREMDGSFGEMIEYLKEKNLYENTWIWLMGDNGPWEVQCQYGGLPGPFQGLWQKKQGGGGTSWKLTVWEGGHRVPAFVSWPNHIKENVVSAEPISALDILPTIMKVIGRSLPTDRHYDGNDISDVIFHGIEQTNRVLFHPRSDILSGNITAVRFDKYKAIFESGGENLLDCQLKSAPLLYHNPPLLFDLSIDPQEEYPLKMSERHKRIIQTIITLRDQKLHDIENDFKSKVDTTLSRSVRPCCNPDDPICRCKKDGAQSSF